MDGKNNDREFEQFLRENADNHRLYPSEEVWYNIHARLHPSKRWPLTALLLLAFTAGSITWLSNSDRSTASATIKNVSPATEKVFAAKQTQTPISISIPAEITTISTSTAEALTPTTIIESDKNLTNAASVSPMETNESNNATVAKTIAEFSVTLKAEPENEQLPLTIESVTNSYQRQKHSPRFNWQVHFTPTVSYRSLKEDQKFIAQARMNLSAAPAAATPELNNVITHRPDLGMQLGVTGTYPLSKRFDFVAGLQFNVSKYDIKAFN